MLKEILESYKKWKIAKTSTGKKFLLWGDPDDSTYIIIWDPYGDGDVYAVSYYAYGGTSGNDDFDVEGLKKLHKNKQYVKDFDMDKIPPVPVEKLSDLDVIDDDSIDEI